MKSGRFIVVEGGEGSGKSTQLQLLAARLRLAGHDVLETFEPGATALGASLRSVLLVDDAPLDARAELLTMVADRAQHVSEVLRPALKRGATVLCDRFTPSSLAYQGIGRGLGVDEVLALDAFATEGLAPHLVIVLDVSATVAAARRPVPTDRMERAGNDFHERVRAGYRDLADDFGWIVIDGDGTPDEVAERVWSVVADQ